MPDDFPYIAPDLRAWAVPLASLTPDPANARQHPARNLAAIQGSLKAFGQQKPIVVTRAGVIVAGNGTYAAAQALSWSHVAARVTELDDAAAAAFAVADNRAAELAEWDLPGLQLALNAMEQNQIDLAALGFTAEDRAALFGGQEVWAPIPIEAGGGSAGAYQEKVVVVVSDMTIRAALTTAIKELIQQRGWQAGAQVNG